MADTKKKSNYNKFSDKVKGNEESGKKDLNNAEQTAKAVKPAKSAKKQSNKAVYSPDGVNFSSKFESDAAYHELAAYEMLQSKFDNSIMDYQTWAREHVHYSGLTKPQMQAKLRQCNDSYTIAAISDMMASFQNGIDFTTIFQFYVSTKVMRAMNPSFDMDVSRLASNLRNSVLSNFNEKSPVTQSLAQKLGDSALSASVSNMGSEIKRNMDQHTIDSMIMTPRQIAAIKLGFMEQCYVDMRAADTNSKVNDIYRDYEKAVKHLGAIADNSGFSMSTVAAEERYLVGLKIRENPSYKNVFQETFDLGVQPDYSNSVWTGDFITMDGSKYTVGIGYGDDYSHSILDKSEMSSFSPRKPYQSNTGADAEAVLRSELSRRARLFAEADRYINDSSICEFNRDAVKSVKGEFDNMLAEYKSNMIDMMIDDGVVKSKSEGSKLMKECFDDVFDDEKKHPRNDIRLAMQREIKHSANKDILSTAGVDISYFTGGNKHVSPEETAKHMQDIRNQVKAFADNAKFEAARYRYMQGENRFDEFFKGKSEVESRDSFRDIRSGQEIIEDMRKNRMSELNSVQSKELLFRAICNIEQGYRDRQTFTRENSLDNEIQLQTVPQGSSPREIPVFDEPEAQSEKDMQSVS